MTGRRLPTNWAGLVRRSRELQNTYTLLDAAALAMTAPLRPIFRDPSVAPDFACLSFYKIFGFPDVGALVVRRDSGHVLTLRNYFGGGTVAMISVFGGEGGGARRAGGGPTGSGGDRGVWHRSKAREVGYALHDALEDGTLPFHSILALGEAIDNHERLYGGQENVGRHTNALVRRMYRGMEALRHANGQPVCKVYCDDDDGSGDGFGDPARQGATIAFNLMDHEGGYVAYSDVERIANDHGIYVRSGGICCPGGLFTALQYEPWQLERAMSAGHHCGSDGISLIHSLPTG